MGCFSRISVCVCLVCTVNKARAKPRPGIKDHCHQTIKTEQNTPFFSYLLNTNAHILLSVTKLVVPLIMQEQLLVHYSFRPIPDYMF